MLGGKGEGEHRQQERQPCEEASKVMAGGGEHGVEASPVAWAR